jgi:ubiquitin
MHISIARTSGKVVDLEVDANDTILAVKGKIHQVQGLPPEQQRLICQGKQLEDSRTLQDYNIQTSTVIHLVTRLRGG